MRDAAPQRAPRQCATCVGPFARIVHKQAKHWELPPRDDTPLPNKSTKAVAVQLRLRSYPPMNAELKVVKTMIPA